METKSVKSKEKLIILGAGQFAEEALDVVTDTGLFEVVSFVEGLDRTQCSKSIAGVPVTWIDELGRFDRSHMLLCAVGSPKRITFITQVEHLGLRFASVVHPSARISRVGNVGKDVFISVGAIVGARTTIGDHVIINRAAVIGHHVVIGPYATISPGANIGGGARIGQGAYVGIGSIILDHISVGKGSVVGAGAVVTKDVPDNVQVLGIPARVTKSLLEDQ